MIRSRLFGEFKPSPICMPEGEDVDDYTTCYAIGWGRLGQKSKGFYHIRFILNCFECELIFKLKAFVHTILILNGYILVLIFPLNKVSIA